MSARLWRDQLGCLALLLAYGVVNRAQDFWGEQIADRGWTEWRIPDALQPALTPVWGVIVALCVVAYLLPRPAPGGTASAE